MTTALAAYMDRQFGPPLQGDDDEDLAAAAMAELLGQGPWRSLMQRGRGGGRGGRGGGGGYRPGGGGGGMTPGMARNVLLQLWQQNPQMLRGEDDDAIEGVDDDELSADEAETELLGADDEDVLGADEEQSLGATVASLDRKIEKIDRHCQKLEAKLIATPEHRWRRRKRLLKAIERCKTHRARKEAKRQAKIAIIAAKMGVPAAALAAGAAGGAAAAYGLTQRQINEAERGAMRGAAAAAEGANGMYRLSPYMGREERLRFQDATGSHYVNVTVAPGAGVRTSTLTMTTPLIPFAEFSVLGVDVKFQAVEATTGAGAVFQANELLVNAELQSVLVTGDINLLYTAQDVLFGAQAAFNNGNLSVSNSRTIPAMRSNSYIETNNTATLVVILRQEIDNTFPVKLNFSAALVVDVRKDKAARRSAAA